MKLPLLLLFFGLLLHQTVAGEYDAALGRAKTKIYHPPSSSCVLRKAFMDPLKLGSCSLSDSWNYTPQKLLTVKGTYFCMQAAGSGQPVRLSIICSPSNSQWQVRKSGSNKMMQLSTMLSDGTTVCLDTAHDGTIISNPCIDLGRAKGNNGDSQWFMIVSGGSQKVNAM